MVLHVVGPQWRVNAVQIGRIDLHFAVLRLRNRNLSGFDRTQDRGFIPADRRSSYVARVCMVLAPVVMSR